MSKIKISVAGCLGRMGQEITKKILSDRRLSFVGGFEHQSHHRGKWAIYLRLVGEVPPGEQLIWKDEDSDTPRDISREEWEMTPNYKKYKKIIDKN